MMESQDGESEALQLVPVAGGATALFLGVRPTATG